MSLTKEKQKQKEKDKKKKAGELVEEEEKPETSESTAAKAEAPEGNSQGHIVILVSQIYTFVFTIPDGDVSLRVIYFCGWKHISWAKGRLLVCK